MSSIEIIYPAICMFILTIGCIFTLGISRYRAIKNHQVKISYFRSYDQGSQPHRLHILSRHVQNHFEVPPLFYVGVILVYVTDTVGVLALICAWLFFGARVVHTFIHVGKNNVNYRFLTFVFSLLCLSGLWLALLFGLVQSAA